jgi:hypothetical protein
VLIEIGVLAAVVEIERSKVVLVFDVTVMNFNKVVLLRLLNKACQRSVPFVCGLLLED